MKSVKPTKVANVRDEFKPIQSHMIVGDQKIVAELEKIGHYNRHPRPRKLRAEHRAAKARAR